MTVMLSDRPLVGIAQRASVWAGRVRVITAVVLPLPPLVRTGSGRAVHTLILDHARQVRVQHELLARNPALRMELDPGEAVLDLVRCEADLELDGSAPARGSAGAAGSARTASRRTV